MHTGTIIEDLIRSVERAETKAREEESCEEETRLQFYDYPVLQRQLSAIEVA